MKKVLLMFCMALATITTLFGQTERTLIVKPIWVTNKTADTDWGGSGAESNERYVMTKVEGQDTLYTCKMALNVYYKNNKWKNDVLFDPENPLKEGWNNEHWFVVVYQDNYGDIENKNNGDAITGAQMFKIEEDDTEVTFYAIIHKDGKIRSYCDAQEVTLNISNNNAGNAVLPPAIGKLSTSTVAEINGNGSSKVEATINNNFLSPNGSLAGGKYAVYERGKFLISLDFKTLQYKILAYEELSNAGGTPTDLVLTGSWSQDTFNTIIGGNAANITTVDFTEVTGLTDFPIIEGLNPNCLFYVNQDVTIPEGTDNVVVFNGETGRAANIVLTESHNFNNVKSFTADKVSYSRDFMDTGWFTMCLPFNVDKGDVIVEEFTNIEGNEIVFTKAESIEANVPYLAKTESPGEKNFEAMGVEINSTENLSPVTPVGGYAFHANYQVIDGENAVGLYLMNGAGTAFTKVAEGNPYSSGVPAFRAYFTTTANKQLMIGHDDGGATDVSSTESTDKLIIISNDGSIEIIAGKAQIMNLYALDGRLVRTLELNEGSNFINGLNKGIYIINHQKVVVK